jgi:hypothetical protein
MHVIGLTPSTTAFVRPQLYDYTGAIIDARFSAGSDVSAMVFDETGEKIIVGCQVSSSLA